MYSFVQPPYQRGHQDEAAFCFGTLGSIGSCAERFSAPSFEFGFRSKFRSGVLGEVATFLVATDSRLVRGDAADSFDNGLRRDSRHEFQGDAKNAGIIMVSLQGVTGHRGGREGGLEQVAATVALDSADAGTRSAPNRQFMLLRRSGAYCIWLGSPCGVERPAARQPTKASQVMCLGPTRSASSAIYKATVALDGAKG